MTAAAPNLRVGFAGLDCASPIWVASGTFGYGKEFAPYLDLADLGGIATKGISPRPRGGNPLPRICETASGMINSIGLENVGVEGFREQKLPFLRAAGTNVVVNFFGETFDEYVACGAALDQMDGVDALEMNVSCPNIKKGGVEFGTDPARPARAHQAVPRGHEEAAHHQADAQLHRRGRAGARGDGGRRRRAQRHQHAVGDGHRRAPAPAAHRHHLRRPVGPRDQADRACAWSIKCIARCPSVPISGIGGIASGEDVVEFLLAGATTVQVGTQSFAEPHAARRIRDELVQFMREEKVSDVRELVGALQGGR